MPVVDPVQARDAVEERHAHIEHDDVRRRLADDAEDLRRVGGRADDLEVAVRLERDAHGLDHQLMVVGQDYPKLCHFPPVLPLTC